MCWVAEMYQVDSRSHKPHPQLSHECPAGCSSAQLLSRDNDARTCGRRSRGDRAAVILYLMMKIKCCQTLNFDSCLVCCIYFIYSLSMDRYYFIHNVHRAKITYTCKGLKLFIFFFFIIFYYQSSWNKFMDQYFNNKNISNSQIKTNDWTVILF